MSLVSEHWYDRAIAAEAKLADAEVALAAEREAHEHTRERERELERGVTALQELVRQGGKHGMDTAR